MTSTGNNTATIHSAIYNATTSCDLPGQAPNIKPQCEWRGSALKFAVANLDPDVSYELKLQNLHQGGGTVFGEYFFLGTRKRKDVD